MTERALRFLIMLAVLLLPFGMIGAGPAMAHHAPAMMTADHCADMPRQKKEAPGRSAQCMIACAALACAEITIEHDSLAPVAAEPARLVPAMHGLHPEAATPPPRFP
jgi:hypothetical protein